jgi:hypothetical protein
LSVYPTACGTQCCGTDAPCRNGQCVCPADHPVQCESFCCLSGAQCTNNGSDCGCPPGSEPCNTTDGCCLVATGGGNPGGGGPGNGGDVGLPCTTTAHPAWQDGECTAPENCASCSPRMCQRVTRQGCCQGADTPSEFFPCAACGNCNAAVQAARARCGCN